MNDSATRQAGLADGTQETPEKQPILGVIGLSQWTA
jgi:hypothetical protein